MITCKSTLKALVRRSFPYSTTWLSIPLTLVLVFLSVRTTDAGKVTRTAECEPATITYEWDDQTCVLITKVEASAHCCWDVYDYYTDGCSRLGKISQNHVKSVKEVSYRARITRCVYIQDPPPARYECSGATTVCDHRKGLTIKAANPAQSGVPVEGAAWDTVSQVFGWVGLWDGSFIYYTFSNNTDNDQIVTWAETPFHGVLVPAHSQETRQLPVTDTPILLQRWLLIEDSQSGVVTSMSVLTAIDPSAVPTLTEWGLIIFGVVLLGFITYVFLRRRRKAVSVGI